MIIPYNQNLLFRAREMRNNSTLSEIILWKELKNRRFGVHFLRQKVIYQYIVDFYCPYLKLAIEVDGKIHNFQKSEDRFRQGELEEFGIIFLRFSDEEVTNDITGVVKKIRECIKNIPPPSGTPLAKGEHC